MALTGRDFIREQVRKRDKYTCQKCGKKWKKGMRRFDVHHLNGMCGKMSRGYDRVIYMDELTTLCHKCHFNTDSVIHKLRKHNDPLTHYNAPMKRHKQPVVASTAPDKTVTIDGDTHELLRVASFESGGKETIKSLIASAVLEKYGKGKK